jgi:hypothetical protein
MLGVLGPVLGYLRTKKINERGYIQKNLNKILIPATGFSGILLQYSVFYTVFKNRHITYGIHKCFHPQETNLDREIAVAADPSGKFADCL